MAEENNLATAEDFRRAQKKAEEEKNPPERVVLPSLGMAVLLRRLSPSWLLWRGRFPASLAQVAAKEKKPEPQSPTDIQEAADYIVAALDAIMVSPKVSLAPRQNEISPDMIDDKDLNFILAWGFGTVAPDGSDLEPFRSQPEPAVAGAVGGHLADETK